MKKTFAKIISLLLTVLMLTSLLSVSAFADATKEGSYVTFEYYNGPGLDKDLTVNVVDASTDAVLETIDCPDAFRTGSSATVSLKEAYYGVYELDRIEIDKGVITGWDGALDDAFKHSFTWSSTGSDSVTMTIYLKAADSTIQLKNSDGSIDLGSIAYKKGLQRTVVNAYLNYNLVSSTEVYVKAAASNNFVLNTNSGYYYGVSANDLDYSSEIPGQTITYPAPYHTLTYGVPSTSISYQNKLNTVDLYFFNFYDGVKVDFTRYINYNTLHPMLSTACPSLNISYTLDGTDYSYVYSRWDQTHTTFVPRKTNIYVSPNLSPAYEVRNWFSADAYGDHANSLYTISGGTLKEETTKLQLGPLSLTIAEGHYALSRDMAFRCGSGYDRLQIALLMEDAEYTLTYDANQGSNPPAPKTYDYNTNVTLSGSATAPADAVFMYWTKDKSDKVFTKDDTAPEKLTSVVMDSDKTVYAAFGLDTNGNGTADVLEDKYSLSYDLNGGSADPAITDANGYLSDEKALLSTQKPTHADVDGTKVLFLGWTAEKDSKIYAKDETKPALLTEVTFGASNMTVYAAWGYDSNGNGIPDVDETFVTLSYDANGGTPTPASQSAAVDATGYATFPITTETVTKDGFTFNGWKQDDVTVSGSISINEDTTLVADWTRNIITYTLTYDPNGGTGGPGSETVSVLADHPLIMDNPPTHDKTAEGDDVLFIGWLGADNEEKVYTGEDDTDALKAALLTKVDVLSTKTVWAAWGVDTNGNGIADVLEDKYALSYDENGGKAEAMPVDTNEYLAGDTAVLQAPAANAHDDVDGSKVLFAGWTEEPVSKLLSKDDTKPDYITEVTFAAAEKPEDGDITVYAAWGLDTNGNGIPDVNEDKFALTYDINGGIGGPDPNPVTGLLAQEDYELEKTAVPTHDDVDGEKVIFAGWTAEKDETLYTKDSETKPAVIRQIDIEDDVTVYAVYSTDSNGNDVPDVFETFATLTYNANGGSGAPDAEEKVMEDGKAEFTVSDTEPTREEYTFKGWSTDKQGAAEYKAGDKLTATPEAKDITLYAVWEQNPLVKFTLTYDANGGKNAPEPQSVETRTGKGELIVTSSKPTRSGYVFLGWSTTKGGKAEIKPGDKVILSADVTVYAVWAKAIDPNIPQTGDNSRLGLWAAGMVLSAMGVAGAVYLGKRKKD